MPGDSYGKSPGIFFSILLADTKSPENRQCRITTLQWQNLWYERRHPHNEKVWLATVLQHP